MAPIDQASALLKELKGKKIRYVRFELPDIHGTSRTKVIPIDSVEGYARDGLNFYGGTIALDSASNVVNGTGMAEEVNYRDQQLVPDPSTVRIVPWLEDTAKVICDARWGPGEPIEAAPRYVLKRLLNEAEKMGYVVLMGHEFEFYLLDRETHKPLFGGVHIFNIVRNQYVPFLDSVLDQLQRIGIDVITHNCEYSPSQFEINFGPGWGIEAADKAFTFKNSIKELAHRAGYLATFMSKPASDMAGSGCHVHINLVKKRGRRNAFNDPKARDGMSNLMCAFTCGILDHAEAMMPLIAPTPNCYRRLKPHTFAPSNISWGIEDRTALVRIKRHPGAEAAHIEMRAASGLSNPYLSAAGVLAAGLLGVKAKRGLPRPSKGPSEENPDLPKLPPNLGAALDGLEADKDMRGMLGEDFVKVFTTVKRFELARFNDHVTDWERNEYLEVY